MGCTPEGLEEIADEQADVDGTGLAAVIQVGAAGGAVAEDRREDVLALAKLLPGLATSSSPCRRSGRWWSRARVPPAVLTGRDLSMTTLMSVKIAVLTPIPRASESTATAVKPGVGASCRRA